MGLGETGLVRWACGHRVVFEDEVDRYVTHLLRPRPRGLVLLDVMHDVGSPDAQRRRLVADAVREVAAGDEVYGHVVVTNSAVVRGTLAAINWFAKASFPEVVVATPAEGLARAKLMSPTVDPDAVIAALHAEVPWFSGLRW